MRGVYYHRKQAEKSLSRVVLIDGSTWEYSEAIRALRVWQELFGFHHTLESVLGNSDWNSDTVKNLLAGINPATGEKIPTEKIQQELLAPFLILDDEPDYFGLRVLAHGIVIPEEVPVHRDCPQLLSHQFGMGKVVKNENLYSIRFSMPIKSLPDFPLYGIPVLNVFERTDTTILKATLVSVAISAMRNADRRIGALAWMPKLSGNFQS